MNFFAQRETLLASVLSQPKTFVQGVGAAGDKTQIVRGEVVLTSTGREAQRRTREELSYPLEQGLGLAPMSEDASARVERVE